MSLRTGLIDIAEAVTCLTRHMIEPQHLRRLGEHFARGALRSVFLGTMYTQNLEWLERFSLDCSCQLCQAPAGSLWHRCYKCPASAEFRRGYCQDFNLDKWLDRIPLSGVAGMLWNTTHAGEPLVRPGRSQAHQAPASRERRAPQKRFCRRLPQARAHEATCTWWMGTGCVERRYEGHGEAARPAPWPPPGHHSGRKCCLLVVPAARQRDGRLVPFHTDSPNVHPFWTKCPEYNTRGQLIYASTWRRI